ncbi:GAF and ANTAR domain-containing protein [Modestobacter altitudinis]|uniref:GAF and ANTAR domain-containing protein n=1 Tax=Modestobacter altitudinis TaxID=2213158 RepID=UPI001FE370F6|nr:GAF and ANTAR domain-containing protein [Modestobacter altitudinis]
MSEPREGQRREAAQAALDELALLILDGQSTQTVLQKVVDLVARVMPGVWDVSMTVVRNDQPTTAAFTGRRAQALDETQHRQGRGPCVEAAIGGHVIEISDGRTETRWPDYMPAFLNAGALGLLAVPVPAAQLSAGLNVYVSEVEAFTEEDRQTIARFADFAAVALTNIDALQDARELAENMRSAMEFRSVIEQAKGILIERHKLTADQAFRLLAEASQRANRKLRNVAEDLVLTGEL